MMGEQHEVSTKEIADSKRSQVGYDHLANISEEQPAYNEAWIGDRRQNRIQRLGFGIISLSFLIVAGVTFIRSLPSLVYGDIFFPAASLLLVFVSLKGLRKSLRGIKRA